MGDEAVGLIGTGMMGEPMARNLLEAGYGLSVFNRTHAKAQGLVDSGANWCDSPSSVAASSDVVITIVSDSSDVEEVYLTGGGVCEGIRRGSLCIDMSTVSPRSAKKVCCAVEKAGGSFLDAPVSGGTTGAQSGKLVIMAGGSEEDLSRARPIFEILGQSIVHCGSVGNGQLTKLCNQILCGLNLLAISEAVVFAKRSGLDPSTMLEAVSKGAAGSWAVDNLGPRMLQEDFAPMFMVDLQQKDLQIALSCAADLSMPVPGTALVSQLLASNQALGEGSEGTQALCKTIERLAKLR